MGEEEFFATRAPHIAQLAGEKRKKAIAALAKDDPRLWGAYVSESHRISATNNFFRNSGRYPLTAVGKLNTYALFSETITQITFESGRAGFITPTGIATDDSTKDFFASLVKNKRLAKLLSLYEIRTWFKSTDDRKSCCLLTLGSSELAEFLFDAKTVEDFEVKEKWFKLSLDEFSLLNPNTLTCPVFRSEYDSELTKKIYRTTPIFIEDENPNGNPWGISFSQGLFNMTSDSHLFHDYPSDSRSPLYEAKLIHQFDHRWATYSQGEKIRDVTIEEKHNPSFRITPRYWVESSEVEHCLNQKGWSRGWLIGWRDIALRSVERTVISSVIPRVGVNHKTPIFFAKKAPNITHVAALLGNINSLVLDYVARQKIGGSSLAYFYLKQFPILPPDRYSEADLAFIAPRILELTYTAHDLASWAKDLGYDGPPFAFDQDRRALLRSELDAYYARL